MNGPNFTHSWVTILGLLATIAIILTAFGLTLGIVIDICINNAIMECSGARSTYAQTKGERRFVGRPAQASFGVAGFRLFSQRSGAAHRMPCQFGDALAGCPAAGRSQGFAGALLSRPPAEAGPSRNENAW